MNLIAIDIGNTNINIGLFLDGREKSIESIPGDAAKKLAEVLKTAWDDIPVAKSSKAKKHAGAIVVSSVKPIWTELVRRLVKETLDEKILLIGKDIPFPMDLSVKEPDKVGTDRVLAAAAAYAVVEDAVVVADFGTAVTIDLVDERGVFLGGCICPGFEISAQVLKDSTALLPKIKISKPETPYGKNTAEAINCGLYYSAVGTLEEVIRRYAEKIGKWPRTLITGSAAAIIKDDCPFIDSHVPNLVVKGIALAYRKHIENRP
jgi:type III pantothenate kinase